MAFTRPIPQVCSHIGCNKRPTLEVLNRYSIWEGAYCQSHADQKLKEVRSRETRTA